jgi:hypothetical protein
MSQTQITAYAASNVAFSFGACSIISPDPAFSHPTYQTPKSRCRQQSCLRCWRRQSERNILNQTHGKWLNVWVKELGGTTMISSNRVVDAWTPEWVGYEHCGEGSHDEKLEYV